MQPQGMKQPQMKINIDDCQDVKCNKEGCDGIYFKQVLRIKKISMIISPSGKDEYQPIQALLCTKCGTELNMEK